MPTPISPATVAFKIAEEIARCVLTNPSGSEDPNPEVKITRSDLMNYGQRNHIRKAFVNSVIKHLEKHHVKILTVGKDWFICRGNYVHSARKKYSSLKELTADVEKVILK